MLERDLVLSLTVKKKASDVGAMTKDAKSLTTEMKATETQIKRTTTEVDKMEKGMNSLKSGVLDLGKATFLLGSAGKGLDGLINNFMKLSGAITGLRGAKDILNNLKDTMGSFKGASGADRLMSMSRMTGIGPKALQGGIDTAKGMASKYGAVAGVGGGAMLAAGGIAMGVNAADSFMTSRGAKPYLGDGAWDRDAGGRLHDWSPTRIANRAELAMIGGGKMDHKGDIVTNDELQNRQVRRAKEQAQRTGHDVMMADLHRGFNTQTTDLERQSASLGGEQKYFGKRQHYQDVISNRMTGEGTGDYKSLLNGQGDRFESVFGRGTGNEKLAQMQRSLREQGRNVGMGVGVATAREMAGQDEIAHQKGVLKKVMDRPVETTGNHENEGQAKAKLEDTEQEQRKLLQLEEKQVELVKARQDARHGELGTMREQARTMEEMFRAEAENARQKMRGMKRSLGAMAPHEARITMGLLKRAKSQGLGSLSPEARSRVSQFMPDEVDKFNEDRGEKMGLGDVLKGTRADRAITDAEAGANDAAKANLNLEQKINVENKMDSDEVSDMIVNKMKPIIGQVMVTVGKVEQKTEALVTGQAGANALTEHTTSNK